MVNVDAMTGADVTAVTPAEVTARTRVDGTAATKTVGTAAGICPDGVHRLDAGPVLDPAQRVVADHGQGPLLVLGAAGTGKTTALVEAAVTHVRDHGVAPERVLLLTFSRGAARTLAERVAERLGATGASVPVLSIHGLCHALWTETTRQDPWRVLTAPEQELRLREVLEGSAEPWPEDVREAIGTRAFTRELRDLVARARQLGLDPADVARLGRAEGRPVWVRAAHLVEEYLDVLDAERVLDYDELVHRVRILLADPATGATLRSRWDRVLVDDLQDAVPAHAALLRDLVPPSSGAGLVVTADPDRAVFSFRGADGDAVVRFPGQHADLLGRLAPVHVLGTDHRHGGRLAAVVHRPMVTRPRPAGLPDWRRPTPVRSAQGAARLAVCTDARDEASVVARALFTGHEEGHIPWHRLAVVVRSRGPEESLLRRRLVRAGIPVAVADDTPLIDEPAVRVLLEVVQTALAAEEPDPAAVERLALGPLGAVDPMDLRRHRRLLAAAGEPGTEAGLARVRRRLEKVAAAIRTTRDAIDAAGSAEEVLWAAWSATDWPQRLRETALGGGADATRADRDLDAVLALFDFAARAGARRGRAGALELLEEVRHQEIAVDTRMTRRLVPDAVEVLTPHRCGGREWDLVIVAGVQEGVWPAARPSRSLIGTDRLGPDGAILPVTPGEVLAEERRLFHLACSRARDTLLVTAVADEAGRPSRFVAELGLEPTVPDPATGPVPTTAALVGELRRVGADPAAGSLVRDEAAIALARLSDQVPAAAPRTWWGAREQTRRAEPLVAPDAPVALSPSGVDALRRCPRRWFLERRAGATAPATEAASIGSLVHDLARRASQGEIPPGQLRGAFDEAWSAIATGPRWRQEARRERAWSMLEAWRAWDTERPAGALVGVEVPFHCELAVDLPDGRTDRVELHGIVDRLESIDGRLVVVDYKTGRRATAREVETLGQLGVYQLAVRAGAFDEVTGGALHRPGAALAVYLDAGEGTPRAVTLGQPSLDDVPAPAGLDVGAAPDWASAAVAEAVRIIRDEDFEARRGSHCRGCPFDGDCPQKGGHA